MGFELSDEKLNEAFVEFKKLADRKKEITEEDLFVLFTDQQIQYKDTPVYKLTNVQVQYGTARYTNSNSFCCCTEWRILTVAETGSGSVEAIFNTLEKLVKGKVHILDYRVTSISKGRDALAEAVVNLSIDDQVITGRDTAQDVLEASAKAYLNAINRQLVKRICTRERSINRQLMTDCSNKNIRRRTHYGKKSSSSTR